MRARERVRRQCVLTSLLALTACTTTLDPTKLGPESADSGDAADDVDPGSGGTDSGGTGAAGAGEPTEPSGCAPEADGAAFLTCADLPPCSSVGADGAHILCSHTLAQDAAAHECELRGGHLAEVDSAEENQLLAEAAGVTGTNVWLGGRRDEAFVWSWTQSQVVFWRGEEAGAAEPGVFVLWAPSEPNNTSTVLDEPEKCLALTLGDMDWNDRACSLTLPFLCEAD